jgi:hypothetical protein
MNMEAWFLHNDFGPFHFSVPMVAILLKNFLPKPACADKMPKNGTQERLFFHISFQPLHSAIVYSFTVEVIV